MKDIKTTDYYRYEFSENSIEVTFRKDVKLPSNSIELYLSIGGLCICVFFLILGGFSYALIFFLPSAILLINVIYTNVNNIRRQKDFHLTIDHSGIAHTDAGASYSLRWSEIKQFGIFGKRFAAHYTTKYIYTPEAFYMYLYFSSQEYDAKQLYKIFARTSRLAHVHYSKKDFIVFAFLSRHIPEDISSRLYRFISEHCAEEKEFSYCDKMW